VYHQNDKILKNDLSFNDENNAITIKIKQIMTKINLILLIVCIGLSNNIQSQTINIGDIPQSRNIISGWEDVKFDESGTWTTVDVTTKGVVPNTGADMGPAIQSMIMAGTGKTIYKFPAGIYSINTTVTITKGDFQVLGEGSATKFLMRGGANPPMLIIEGARAGGAQKLQTAINRGDDKITLVNVSGFSVGDFIFIRQANGERNWDIDTQIVKILAINGNTLTLDMKIGLPFSVEKASAEKLNMLKNVKLSEFYIERLTEPDVREGKLRLAYINNGLISHVESNKTLAQHIEINDSRNVLLFQNNIYGNFGRDHSGGYQGGIVLNRSTRVNIINNRLHDLRHHIALQFGSSFCVIAYNRTSKFNDYGDYGQHNSKGCHNNLFEGNYGSELYDDWNIKAWGSPYAMWFRNHAVDKIGTEYLGQMHMSIIGNELRVGEIGLKLAAPENDNFVGANIVSIDKENGIGTMLWGNLPANATLPNSLFLTEKPAYLEKWPLYGPGTEGTGTTEPVDQPKDIIYKETVLPAGFTYATEEKATVKVTGLMDIAFGIAGSYHILYNQSADLVCGTDVFNDPAPGVRKQCFTRNSVLGIDTNLAPENKIIISPNPNKGIFTITRSSSTPGIYEVFDMNGQLVTQGQLNEASQQVQIKGVASGLYFLKVVEEGGGNIEKIIIQK
jgi:hypothetical protein